MGKRAGILFSVLVIVAMGALVSPGVRLARSANADAETNQEWPVTGGDFSNHRYTALSQITAQNVKQLGGAWISPKFDDGSSSRAIPVIKDGLMFITAGPYVYALNAKTGQLAWKFNADSSVTGADLSKGQGLNQLEGLSSSGHSVPNAQGVVVADGKVFFGTVDGMVTALSEESGKLRWSKRAIDLPARNMIGLVVPTAPTYADGKIFVGTNGDYGTDAKILALDAETGEQAWHFNVVPEPGETGHETWPQEGGAWKHGGGGVWQTGAIDPDLGLVYFGTGNAVPQYGGGGRQGTNLYTDCVIALEIKTGKLRWYQQLVHHDIWEADVAMPVILYDTQVDGKPFRGVGALRPDGYLFLFDRVTGKPLVPIQEKPVTQSAWQKTWPTEPFPAVPEGVVPECSSWKDSVPKGWSLDCEFYPWDFGSMVLAPGFLIRATPMAYSPQTGYFYAQGTSAIRPHRLPTDDPWFFALGTGDIALLSLPPAKSFVTAIDGRTDRVVWKKEVPATELSRSFAGPLATGGGLLFRATPRGALEAWDAKNGEVIWQFQTDGQGGPVVSYQMDGEQYVAMVTGPAVMTFKLGGTIPQAKVEAPRQTGGGLETGGTDIDQIETTTLIRDHDNSGQRYAIDEDTFNPTRARVKVGARVIFLNNGRTPRTIVAKDGSWTTGVLEADDGAPVTFSKPGVYPYYSKEHPWAVGEVIVVAGNENQDAGGVFSAAQAQRGQAAYGQYCAACHQTDLSGSSQFPALKGDAFLAEWQGHKVNELMDRTRTTMPQTAPGSLDRNIYIDIVSYILQMNEMPAGKEELKADSAKTIGK
jgi:PQQ-dependent dehydrogenase (methanol/ethanol family)